MIFSASGTSVRIRTMAMCRKQWAAIAPSGATGQLVTTANSRSRGATRGDSTFYGDLFAHVVSWRGELYLEDGLHRALRAALQQRQTMHARVLDLEVAVGRDRLRRGQRGEEYQR